MLGMDASGPVRPGDVCVALYLLYTYAVYSIRGHYSVIGSGDGGGGGAANPPANYNLLIIILLP
jgi:hypothetical protein